MNSDILQARVCAGNKSFTAHADANLLLAANGLPTLRMHTTSKLPRFSIRQHRIGRPK